MATSIITPLRWAGAKNKLLPALEPYLDSLLLNKDKFCDVFIGGGSVLLWCAKKYPKIQLFANDKDAGIANFWSVVVSNQSQKLQDLFTLMQSIPTVELFFKLKETAPQSDVEWAYRTIFLNRCSFSGMMNSPIGGKEQKSKWGVGCRYNFNKLKEKILYCHELLKDRTIISNLDFCSYQILSDNDTVKYLDPPYFKVGHMLYDEYMLEKEHINLANILKNTTNWVLSYDDCSEIRSLYSNQKIIDLAARYCINGKKNNWEHKNELIILGN